MASQQQRAELGARQFLTVESECDAEDLPARRSGLTTAGTVALACLAALGGFALAASGVGGGASVRGAATARGTSGIAQLTLIAPRSTEADRHPMVEHPAEVKTCSWGKANCNATKCCNNAGMQCMQQNAYYSQCRDTCTAAPDPTHWDGEPWSCKVLGERSPGSSKCSEPGEDCSQTKCCSQANTRCFEKAPGWAACKTECAPDGPDLTDSDGHYWSCNKLGPWAEGPQPWVEEKCTADGEDCRETQCCKTPGAMCYEQSSDWASCKFDCNAGQDPERSWEPEWSCKELGIRTPGAGPAPTEVVSSWVGDECAWQATDCKGPRCCVGMNQQCYEKNDNFAMCMEECVPGPHKEDNNESWSCRQLGPRSKGLAVKGSPSLFCWSLFQPTSYEMGIIQNQLTKGLGIFQCDGYVLLSTADPTSVGTGADGKDVTSLHVDMAEITQSVDGTAGNAALFINCWNVIIQDGHWNNYAWTVKVDPDAVLLPDRLRQHLAPHVLENVFVLNCNAYPSSPEFPMMYGALEIFSWKAISSYASNMWLCMRDMAEFIPLWGEDRFMKKCMDYIGVNAIEDFAAVGDGVCTGVDCGSSFVASFHPFKTVDSWQQCWNIAHR